MRNMPENITTNAQTLVINSDEFSYSTIEKENGFATLVKFRIDNPQVTPGDVLLILSGEDILFHGIIGGIDDGYALASDRRGSQLPAQMH